MESCASKSAEPDAAWYAKGLRFECARCRRCCTGPPGYVWVTGEEIERIADFLGTTPRAVTRRHSRRVWWRISLKERRNGDCVFLADKGCRIYAVRPAQCHTFPFWPDNVTSPERWEQLKRRCPGVGRGRLYSREEIESIAATESST
ncbi:MAG: YkgJ family cysteine cluster protein [Planctomycetota bacterium]